MINKLEQLQNFQDSVESRDALDRLRALQYMQAQSQGLMGLPVVQRSVGGGAAGGAGGGGAAANPGFIPQRPAYGGRGLPSAPMIQQNIPQQPEENIVNIPIAAEGNLELNTASITPTEVAPQMMAAPEAPIAAIGPTGLELPQEQPQPMGLASLGGSGIMRPAKEGGPIVHRFTGGIGTVIPNLHERVSLGDKGLGLGGVADVIQQARAAGFFPSEAQTPTPVTQVLPTPQVVPEAGPQVQQAPSMSTLADVNADTLSRNGEGSVFAYGDQNYQASSGGPTLLHSLTEEGMRNRAIRGGLLDYEGRDPTYAPDISTLSEADIFRTPRGYGPSPAIPQDPNATGPFIGKEPPQGSIELSDFLPVEIMKGTEARGPQPMGPTQPNLKQSPALFGPGSIPSTGTPAGLPVGPSRVIAPSEQALLATGPFINQQSTFSPVEQQPMTLWGGNIQGFKSKEIAMEHQRQNEGGALRTQVYQLPDGSWDYQRGPKGGPTPIGMPVTPGGPLIASSPATAAGLMGHRRNPVTGDYERYDDPNIVRAGGGQIADTAEGLASLGRGGDDILVHMNPEELQGLNSLGNITYNPITGLPEAFGFGGFFKAVRKIAPIALAIAAPYAAAAWAPALFGATGVGALGGMGALGFGAATGIGSFLGNMIAGAKPGDALKAGLMSGAMGGVGRGLSTGNWLGAQGAAGGMPAYGVTPSSGQTMLSQLNTGVAPSQGLQPASQFGTPAASNVASSARIGLGGTIAPRVAPLQLAQVTPGSPQGYMGQIQPTVATDIPSNLGSRIQFEGGGQQIVGGAPSAPTTVGTIKQIGKDIWKDYGTLTGAAKVVGMDLMTPDWEAEYAAMDAAKKRQLSDAGYTVDTGFDGQTVIRDSSGVVQPKNLTVQQILDRAYGRTPRTRLVERYGYEPTKTAQGGLISLAHGGDFRGSVEGRGHGMEDNIFMPIRERGKEIGTLAVSPSEYVVDAHTMSALGNGNADAGAKVMDGVVESVRKKAYGTIRQPNEIDGLQALRPLMERV